MRVVVLLCGPPGAGKTTAARASGLTVFDRDDPQWTSEKQFTTAMAKLAHDPGARAVVIRTAASSAARARAAQLIAATHTFVLAAEYDELVQRIRARNRGDKVRTIAGVRTWFDRFDREDNVKPFTGWHAIQEPDLGVVSEDW